MESADHVFAKQMIHCRFAADRGVNLCEQRCWNLNEGYPALINGCSKTRHITHNASAKRDERGFPRVTSP